MSAFIYTFSLQSILKNINELHGFDVAVFGSIKLVYLCEHRENLLVHFKPFGNDEDNVESVGEQVCLSLLNKLFKSFLNGPH